jgi:hypothetical protein
MTATLTSAAALVAVDPVFSEPKRPVSAACSSMLPRRLGGPRRPGQGRAHGTAGHRTSPVIAGRAGARSGESGLLCSAS